MVIESKLSKLEKKAISRNQYALAAASAHLLANMGDMDRQINLLGALHEVGYLKNSLAVYWKAFRTDESAWIKKCLSRLKSTDHDYWALAALLGCHAPSTINAAIAMGFQSLAVWRTDSASRHTHTLYLEATEKLLHPILEIGYNVKEMVNIDLGRARALNLSTQSYRDSKHLEPGELIGNGWLYLSMQAKLPYGAWRSVSARFQIKKEWIVANAA